MLWDALRQKGTSSFEAVELLGVPRSTLYRWKKKLREEGPRGLEPRSKRPRRVRERTWSPKLSGARDCCLQVTVAHSGFQICVRGLLRAGG